MHVCIRKEKGGGPKIQCHSVLFLKKGERILVSAGPAAGMGMYPYDGDGAFITDIADVSCNISHLLVGRGFFFSRLILFFFSWMQFLL